MFAELLCSGNGSFMATTDKVNKEQAVEIETTRELGLKRKVGNVRLFKTSYVGFKLN